MVFHVDIIFREFFNKTRRKCWHPVYVSISLPSINSPIIYKRDKYRDPAPEVVELTHPFHSGRKDLQEKLIQKLRKIHIHKSVDPDPMWWLADELDKLEI